MRTQDQVAVITGAGRGIGKAIALGLAREGAHIAIGYLSDLKEAMTVVSEIRALGRRAIAVQVDTTRRPLVQQMVDAVMAEFGQIDILVNNAGVMNTASFLELTDDEWDMVHATNLKGYFTVGQCVARAMVGRGYGRIVNISSARQVQATTGNTAYASAKGGVFMLTRMMALELAPLGICVNSVAPGTIETDLNRHYLVDPAVRQQRLSLIPAGRLGEPDDIVGAALFLASPEARYCVGTTIYVDGGQTIM